MKTAHDAYLEMSLEVKAKLAQISERVALHAKNEAAFKTNWGFVGDMAHVNALLSGALENLPNPR